MPKGYWIARIDVDDPAGYEGYKRAAAAAVADHGGRYIVRGGPQEAAEGTARARTVIVEFPSYGAALACYHGPAYQAAAALRQAAAQSEFLIVSGSDG